MKKIYSITIFLCTLVVVACSNSNESPVSGQLLPPSNVTVERIAQDAVSVSWSDNTDAESGYAIVMRKANEPAFTDVATVAKDVTSYKIVGSLVEGNSYYIGVKAFNDNEETRVASVLYKMEVLADLPAAEFTEAVKANGNCVSARYVVRNISGHSKVEYGLCWEEGVTPTVESTKLLGPELAKDGSVFQVIPNALLDYGKSYKVRAFVKTAAGVYYSKEYEVKLESQPQAVKLDWKKLSFPSLPAEIEVYETTSLLNGDKFHAWYAIADLSGNVELRVNVPSAATTIDDQAKAFNGNCYVMINGGYFYNGRNTGVSVVNSAKSGNVSTVRGSLKTADTEEYNKLYHVTRGLFGVDASGKPDVKWVGTNDAGNVFYFDCPLPSVKGENKYGEVSGTRPVEAVAWAPKYALSAGPVLLKDGKIPFDFTLTDKGTDYYLSNYEIMPYDIYGTNVSPDRTAVGYTADGKVILFICDGRIADSDGATLFELAQIMKGLGCVSAVNFDGGGSTGMVVDSKHLNDMTGGNRPVVSTIGFFKK